MDKSKLMMIIIIALLVLLLGTVVGVTFYLINLVGDDSPEDFHYVIEAPPPPNLSLLDLIEVPLGDRITVNLAIGASGTSDLVSAEVVLGIDNTGDEGEAQEFADEVNERMRLARGIVIDVFNGLTYDEIRTPEGRAMAQEEVKLRLQQSFNSNLIIVVEFSDWWLSQGTRGR